MPKQVAPVRRQSAAAPSDASASEHYAVNASGVPYPVMIAYDLPMF
jgi:hypothetical protein